MSKHPGFDWLISPTKDWHEPADDAWHWAAYLKDGTRFHGFAPTEVDARQRVDAVLEDHGMAA